MTNDLGKHLSQKSRIGFYFHIPFCPHVCPYCDFVKTSRFSKNDVDAYFVELKNQTTEFLKLLPHEQTHATVYFGGGTPGLFDAKFYAPLIELIANRITIEECTIETNPFTNSAKKIADYKKIGFDRMTLGAQSLCEKTLKVLGRKHTRDDVLRNVNEALSAGISQLQVDLIYGLKPGLRSHTLASEIETVVRQGATGISAYALAIEKRTLFANTDWANDDSAADEYVQLYETCAAFGLKQIETSNFSKYEARHNNIYWYGLPYFGVGTGAHGLLPSTSQHPYGQRYSIGKIDSELAPGDDNLKDLTTAQRFVITYEEPRTKQQFIDELVFTTLRTPLGLPLKILESIVGSALVEKLKSDQKIKRACDEGLIALNNEFLALTWKEKIRGDSWALHLSWLLQIS